MPKVLAQSNLPNNAAVVVSSETIILRDPNNRILEKYTSDEQKQLSLKSYGIKPATLLSPGPNNTKPSPGPDEIFAWLQNNGAAYVDTGIMLKASDKLEVKFQHIEGSVNYICGVNDAQSQSSNNKKRYDIIVRNISTNFLTCVAYCNYSSNSSISVSDVPNSQIVASLADGQFIINDMEPVAVPQYDATLVWSRPLYIFGINNIGVLQQQGSIKLFYLKITNSENVIIHNFVPAKQNETFGLYDTVEQMFYPNTNSEGEFIAGNDLSTISLGMSNPLDLNPASTDVIDEPQDESM